MSRETLAQRCEAQFSWSPIDEQEIVNSLPFPESGQVIVRVECPHCKFTCARSADAYSAEVALVSILEASCSKWDKINHPLSVPLLALYPKFVLRLRLSRKKSTPPVS